MFVQKWVDYSEKYGLGYQLSDGTYGIHFNDATKILLQPPKLFYIERDRTGTSRKDTITEFTQENFPSEIKKKVDIAKHFSKYFQKPQNSAKVSKLLAPSTAEPQSTIYVKKWHKTSHGIFFCLSNQLV